MKLGLFPGQDIPAQSVLEALPTGDSLVDRASEVLCYDLRKGVEIATRQPRAVLPPSLAQPAIFTASLVSWNALGGKGCDALLGHGLGEYAALVAAEAMSFKHGLCAVQVRGDIMQLIASRTTGGMVAFLDLTIDDCEEIARGTDVVVAKDNAPTQVVVAGSDEALARAAEVARSRGGRAVRLDITGPFHTPAMSSAIPKLRAALDHSFIRSPRMLVVSNVSAGAYRAPGEIRRLLIEQLVARDRFREALYWLWDRGARDFVDFGPGRVVGKLAAQTFEFLQSESEPVAI